MLILLVQIVCNRSTLWQMRSGWTTYASISPEHRIYYTATTTDTATATATGAMAHAAALAPAPAPVLLLLLLLLLLRLVHCS